MEQVSVSEQAKSRAGWALVTGGARRIGLAICEELHERGLNIAIHCLGSREPAAALADRLNGRRPSSAVVLNANLVARDGPESLAAAMLEISSEVKLLVNNASRFYPTPLGEVDGSTWQDLMGSNVRGAFFLSQALAPALAGGAIVNIIDIHARRPMPGHSVYSMAKAALEMMTRSLALELAPEIRVNGVAPGAILWPETEAGVQEQAAILERVALGRAGEPCDIARAVSFLGLDAPYVTGQVLAVDGGRSLNI